MSYHPIFWVAIFLVLGKCTLSAQIKPTRDTSMSKLDWVYDPSTTPARYQEGLRLQQDSLKKAWNIFSLIIKYDSTSNEARVLKVLRDSLIDAKIRDVKRDLNGKWMWLADGSNWGVSDTPEACQCERYLVATDSTFTIYRDGKPEKPIAYHFLRLAGMIYFDSYVVALDNGEKWVIHLADEPYYWSYSSVKKRTGRFLNINMWYLCACGCPEESFVKKDK
jgi:hypothetical protein